MEMSKRDERRGGLFLRAVLLVLILVSVYGAGSAAAKYISSDSANQSSRVGEFVLHVDKDGAHSTALRLDDIRKPGDTATYAFKVTNTQTHTSEVDETYTLTILLNGDLPLTFALTRPAGEAKAWELDATEYLMEDDAAGRSFKADVSAQKDYTLTVSWPTTAEAMDAAFASDAAVATCVLTVSGEQTD